MTRYREVRMRMQSEIKLKMLRSTRDCEICRGMNERARRDLIENAEEVAR